MFPQILEEFPRTIQPCTQYTVHQMALEEWYQIQLKSISPTQKKKLPGFHSSDTLTRISMREMSA
jgi:hypothetical protein